MPDSDERVHGDGSAADEAVPAPLLTDTHTTATAVLPPEPLSETPEASRADPSPSGAGFEPPLADAFAAAPPIDASPPRKGLALAALILGIAAFLAGWVPILGIALGVTAVVLGTLALVRRQTKGFAITGIALGAVGLLASIVVSVVAFAVLTNYDAFVEGVEQGTEIASPPSAPAEEAATEDGAAAPADEGPAAELPALSAFVPLDDAGFAALVADPNAAYGATHVLYGEIQQLDESTGPCSALMTVDDAQQASWEGYAVTAWILAESGETVCPEFAGLAPLGHVKVWATVLGTSATEFDDGTVADVLTLGVRQYEALPPLP